MSMLEVTDFTSMPSKPKFCKAEVVREDGVYGGTENLAVEQALNKNMVTEIIILFKINVPLSGMSVEDLITTIINNGFLKMTLSIYQ